MAYHFMTVQELLLYDSKGIYRQGSWIHSNFKLYETQ